MAYDEFLADKIRQQLIEKPIRFDELKMMGGLCFKNTENYVLLF